MVHSSVDRHLSESGGVNLGHCADGELVPSTVEVYEIDGYRVPTVDRYDREVG